MLNCWPPYKYVDFDNILEIADYFGVSFDSCVYKIAYRNLQQMQAVQAIDKATLLLAVPGSEKITVIITRIGNMIYNHSILPEQILTLTLVLRQLKI